MSWYEELGVKNPYYADDAVVIINADCRDVLPTLGRFDLLLTDPPYGIGKKWVGGKGHGWGRADSDKIVRNEWDSETPSQEIINICIGIAQQSIIWGGNYFDLPLSRGWLVWTKPERNFTLSEAELAWTSRDAVIRVWDGVRSDSGREHPTQKPLALMAWCIRIAEGGGDCLNTILDPFAGSGTTGRAAKDMGKKCVLIEREEKYCAIAARRMAQEVLF